VVRCLAGVQGGPEAVEHAEGVVGPRFPEVVGLRELLAGLREGGFDVLAHLRGRLGEQFLVVQRRLCHTDT
jgi:hypothetical protein